MSNEAVVNVAAPVPAAAGLNQVERVVDTFVAPTKTFQDILRSSSWWLPFLLILLTSALFTVSVDRQVGFDRVYDNILRESPKAQDRISQLTPEQRTAQVTIGVKFTKIISYAFPVIVLIVVAIYSLILWAAFNFGLGATTKYPQVFAVVMYAALPGMLLGILTWVTVTFGANADAFNINDPVGTNLAYYMPDASLWMKSLLGRLDILKLWTLALETVGMAVIAKKTVVQSAVVVVGFWLLITVISVGYAAMQS